MHSTQRFSWDHLNFNSPRLLTLLVLATALTLLMTFAGTTAAKAAAKAATNPLPNDVVVALASQGITCQSGVCKPSKDAKAATLDGGKLNRNLLRGQDFGGWRFEGISFRNVNLENANFADSAFTNVEFSNVNMNAAKLNGAKMDTVAFTQETNLGGSNLEAATMQNVRFENARLFDAKLTKSKMIDVSFQDADLRLSRIDNATLSDVTFTKVDMEHANLRGVQATGLRLDRVGLNFTNLSHANLDGTVKDQSGRTSLAEWSGIALMGANVSGTKITNTDISKLEVGPILDPSQFEISSSKMSAATATDLIGKGVQKLTGNQFSGTWGPPDGDPDLVVRKVDLSGSSFTNFKIQNTTFVDSTLNAISINADKQSTLSNVKILDSGLNHANFSAIDAKNLEIRMTQGQEVRDFDLTSVRCEQCLIEGNFRDADLSHSKWTGSDLKGLRGGNDADKYQPGKREPGEFDVYLNNTTLEHTTLPKDSEFFNYEGSSWGKGTEVPDGAKFTESRLHAANISEVKMGRGVQFDNCVATNLNSAEVTYESVTFKNTDLAKARFAKSTFTGQHTKFEQSTLEDTSFQDITLKGQRFSITGWIRNLLISWGVLSPSSSVSFTGSRIEGAIDLSGQREVGESKIIWDGAIAEPGAAVILTDQRAARTVNSDMTSAGIAMDRVQVDYLGQGGERSAFRNATVLPNGRQHDMQRSTEKARAAKTNDAYKYYERAQSEREAFRKAELARRGLK